MAMGAGRLIASGWAQRCTWCTLAWNVVCSKQRNGPYGPKGNHFNWQPSGRKSTHNARNSVLPRFRYSLSCLPRSSGILIWPGLYVVGAACRTTSCACMGLCWGFWGCIRAGCSVCRFWLLALAFGGDFAGGLLFPPPGWMCVWGVGGTLYGGLVIGLGVEGLLWSQWWWSGLARLQSQ